jgi:NAD(P)-dependent dehydrogenase (short-subunit alcohol dehydrogenase family)
MNISPKVVFVTGASQGIGAEVRSAIVYLDSAPFVNYDRSHPGGGNGELGWGGLPTDEYP